MSFSTSTTITAPKAATQPAKQKPMEMKGKAQQLLPFTFPTKASASTAVGGAGQAPFAIPRRAGAETGVVDASKTAGDKRRAGEAFSEAAPAAPVVGPPPSLAPLGRAAAEPTRYKSGRKKYDRIGEKKHQADMRGFKGTLNAGEAAVLHDQTRAGCGRLPTTEGRWVRFEHDGFSVNLLVAKQPEGPTVVADRGQLSPFGANAARFFGYIKKAGHIEPKGNVSFIWSTGQPAGRSFAVSVRDALPGATFELVGEPLSVDDRIDRSIGVKADARAAGV